MEKIIFVVLTNLSPVCLDFHTGSKKLFKNISWNINSFDLRLFWSPWNWCAESCLKPRILRSKPLKPNFKLKFFPFLINFREAALLSGCTSPWYFVPAPGYSLSTFCLSPSTFHYKLRIDCEKGGLAVHIQKDFRDLIQGSFYILSQVLDKRIYVHKSFPGVYCRKIAEVTGNFFASFRKHYLDFLAEFELKNFMFFLTTPDFLTKRW